MSPKKKNKKKRSKVKTTAKKKTAARKTSRVAKKTVRKGKPNRVGVVSRSQAALSGGQSGDLQGLSTRAGADSESVQELLEEGNPFEAGVVTGVEEAERSAERPVHTHEVPEDDVPGEYLDKD